MCRENMIVDKMQTIEESIAAAMDWRRDTAIVPYLPYILQDFWELGTPPEIVINFIQKHCVGVETRHATSLQVLDLGCGKGAVSVKVATALKCNCYGIDGIPEFVEAAEEKAKEYGVDSLCRFEVGDIRHKIEELDTFDVIILGAIGQVFGDYYTTLTTLSKHLTDDGIIIINDAYIEDTSSFQRPDILKHRELVKQISQAGMELIDEYTDKAADNAEDIENLQKRCKELMKIIPDKKSLFENYLQTQIDEYEALENKMIGSVMVVKKIV
jgi:cyclopropane fatty-acyl-phospholipid synthase-like methyltransferase